VSSSFEVGWSCILVRLCQMPSLKPRKYNKLRLDFNITFYREGDTVTDFIDVDHLGSKASLEDDFSSQKGYYNEAIIEMGMLSRGKVVAKKRQQHSISKNQV